MDDRIFSTLAEETLTAIESAFEHCDADIDFELGTGGVLDVEFADGSKMVINTHSVAQEIWVAARAGGFHFRHDGQRWRDTRDGEELFARLSHLASGQAGEPISLTG